MMVESLKPTPVSVTTPTMMPTVAAAAPTLIAYLAPTTKASSDVDEPRPAVLVPQHVPGRDGDAGGDDGEEPGPFGQNCRGSTRADDRRQQARRR